MATDAFSNGTAAVSIIMKNNTCLVREVFWRFAGEVTLADRAERAPATIGPNAN
jgi:hypothetical protein